jgi:hypothetical protein
VCVCVCVYVCVCLLISGVVLDTRALYYSRGGSYEFYTVILSLASLLAYVCEIQ